LKHNSLGTHRDRRIKAIVLSTFTDAISKMVSGMRSGVSLFVQIALNFSAIGFASGFIVDGEVVKNAVNLIGSGPLADFIMYKI
jgi:hypothetical protein